MKYSIHSPLKMFRNSKGSAARKSQPFPPRPKETPVSPTIGGSLFTMERLRESISKARNYLLSFQNAEGYWVFDLEADTTIPSEYLLLQRFLGRETPPSLKRKIRRYLIRKQLPDGGWSLFTGGDSNISASVKAYFALKVLGESARAPHMEKAGRLIRRMGGAAKVNVFTRITLALFGQIPWRTTPAMPVEIVLLPRWFYFHLQKVSYWSRAVIVPLLILYAKRPICTLSPPESIRELFLEPPESLCHLDPFIPGNYLKNAFILVDRLMKRGEAFIPRSLRAKAIRAAEEWTLERMKGVGGIGAIFPAMANAVMALRILGYPEDHSDYVRGINAIDDLLVVKDEDAYCQPCVSPIWDSCLSASALLEAGLSPDRDAIKRSVDWLFQQMIFQKGDWSVRAPELEPGCWAFQFENTFYPDVDDTAMVAMAILRAGEGHYEERSGKLAASVNWILGMQSSDGGWGAFDIDNNYLYLNEIPFADHGALLDPSTSDLTARCIELLCMVGYNKHFPPVAKAIKFLKKEQTDYGPWFGRWGVNYLYGTWSVLMALRIAGEDMSQPYIRKGVDWLKSTQNADYGWGEQCDSYVDTLLAGRGQSTPSQTAWALLGLMAAGEVNSAAVQRGIHFLLSSQNGMGGWDEDCFTGTGFPGVFYLRYHGYKDYFPLWALGIYRRLRVERKTRQDEVLVKTPADFNLPAQKRRVWGLFSSTSSPRG